MSIHAPEIQTLNPAGIYMVRGASPLMGATFPHHRTLLIRGWIFPVDAFEHVAPKFCQRMTGVLPL